MVFNRQSLKSDVWRGLERIGMCSPAVAHISRLLTCMQVSPCFGEFNICKRFQQRFASSSDTGCQACLIMSAGGPLLSDGLIMESETPRWKRCQRMLFLHILSAQMNKTQHSFSPPPCYSTATRRRRKTNSKIVQSLASEAHVHKGLLSHRLFPPLFLKCIACHIAGDISWAGIPKGHFSIDWMPLSWPCKNDFFVG